MAQSLGTLTLFHGDASPPRLEAHARAHRGSQLWMAVYFPNFALDALSATNVDKAAVVTELWDGPAHVIAANGAALAFGIRPGLRLSAALGLDDSLEVFARCRESEQSKLESLANLARRFTPVVSLEPPDVLFLEVSGSLKLFGGIAPIKDQLADLLRSQHVAFRMCVAPTTFAALWLARCGESDVLAEEKLAGRLSRVPLEATGWPDKTQALLKNMGIRTLGDCMRLPRDGFARRIGPRYLQELDKSRGAHDPRLMFEPVPELTLHAEFADEIDSTALLMRVGRKLIVDLSEDLRIRQLRIPGFDCVFGHLNRQQTTEHVKFSEPTRDQERFTSLLMDRLEQLRLKAPVIRLTLRAHPPEPEIIERRSLFGDPAGIDAESAACSLIERLQARFGIENLYGVDLVDEHRPEAAWSKSTRFLEQGRRPPIVVERLPQRPLWLLPVPKRLRSTIDDLPCYQNLRPLRVERDLERVESGWWDNGDIGRDYYIASDVHGEKLWIFQERFPERGWYLHGFFG